MESEEIIKLLVEIRDLLHEQLNDSRSAREEFRDNALLDQGKLAEQCKCL
jgi:hypothetical protein